MEYINLDPLYKLLCLIIIFLVPLLPAMALYKIAPSERFLAKGTFSGFKINATGASAIYIVLFLALYHQTDAVTKNIDSSSELVKRIQYLESNRPWQVKYILKIMSDDGLHEISPVEYAKYIDPDSIVCFPQAMTFDGYKTLSFYLDNKALANIDDTINSQILLRNGYGTTSLNITKSLEDPGNRTITLRSVFYKQRSKPSQLTALNNHQLAPIEKSAARVKPPLVSH